MGSTTSPHIPIVDFAPFLLPPSNHNSSPSLRQQTAKTLAESCHQHGCAAITGHGVSKELLERAFEVSKGLFDLSVEEKMLAPHPEGMVPHRGYSGFGRERAGGKGGVEVKGEGDDYKESYEVGSEGNREHYNIWLPEDVLPGFRDFTTMFYWRLGEVAGAVLEALMMGLGFTDEEKEYVRGLHGGDTNQLRLLHYPAMGEDSGQDGKRNESRLGAHTDFSSFTFLFQDSHQGLEYLNRETGEFMAATPKPDTMYMNIGDMFMRLSNGYYPAGTHRVVIPGSSRSARYSIPYFVSPDPDAVVSPQPSCVAKGQKRLYEPLTYRKYRDEMYKKTQVREKANKSQ